MSARWSRGSIRRCERRSIATAISSHGDASIGIAIAPRDGSDLFELLKNADLAMYAAKAAGRRTYRFFDPDDGAAGQSSPRARGRICARRWRKAASNCTISRRSICAATEITGCEALLRWRHPVRGMVSPADFVPVAEETGLIEEIGQWVLRTACAEAATWPAHVRIAVNVSPVQFRSETLSLKVAAALAETGLDPRRLELEITEAVLIADDDAALVDAEPAARARRSHRARRFRHRLFLAAIPAAVSVRQDQDRPQLRQGSDAQFVGSASIIRAVVSIAADRNMITTAEGVETEQQRETVQNRSAARRCRAICSAPRARRRKSAGCLPQATSQRKRRPKIVPPARGEPPGVRRDERGGRRRRRGPRRAAATNSNTRSGWSAR